jgi:hypothetical protein
VLLVQESKLQREILQWEDLVCQIAWLERTVRGEIVLGFWKTQSKVLQYLQVLVYWNQRWLASEVVPEFSHTLTVKNPFQEKNWILKGVFQSIVKLQVMMKILLGLYYHLSIITSLHRCSKVRTIIEHSQKMETRTSDHQEW